MKDLLRVLIVDDNPEYCAELEQCFSGSDSFRVLPFAASGKAAIEAFSTQKPDIVILDMIMPEMDGMEVLQVLAERRLGQDAMIFASSPFYLDASIIQKAQDLGIVYFFYKPISAAAVYGRILDTVNARRRMFEKREERKRELDTKCEQFTANYLRIIGIRPHLKGYTYLKVAIQYCIDHYGRMPGVTTEIYPYVAQQCNSTPRRVERDIRTAIEYAWSHGDLEAQHSFFGYTINSHKGTPTSKELIAMLTERVAIRLKKV